MNTEIKIKELWYRRCPICQKELSYSSEQSCLISLELFPCCEDCRNPIKPGQNRSKKLKKYNKREIITDNDIGFLAKCGERWITKCPECKKDISHSNENNARTSIKSNRICRQCSSRKNIKENPKFTFQDHKHSDKTKKRQSEVACNLWDYKKNIQPQIIAEIEASGSIQHDCGCYKKLNE